MKPGASSLLTAAVAALSLAVCGWLWRHELQSEATHRQARFDFALRQAATEVEERLGSFQQILLDTAGLFDVADRIDPIRFDAYADRVLSGPDSAGLQSLSFTPLVDGDHAPVAMIAPASGRNLKVLGFDTLSDTVRTEAMMQARDSGQIAMTRRIRFIVDEGVSLPSFLMVAPRYAPHAPVGTVAERRAALVGWVWAAFRVRDLMASTYGSAASGLDVRLYDGTEVSEATQIYRALPPQVREPEGTLEGREYVGIAGRTWTLSLRMAPDFESGPGPAVSRVILIAGLVLSGLLALLTHLLVTARARAHARALAMTEELRASEARLRESQKMEAIGTLAGGIAHDFNNILAAILGNVAMARQDERAGLAVAASLAQVERAAVRARSLVQQILTFSRMQPQALSTQPLQPRIEEAVRLLRATLPAQVELKLRLPAEPVHVRADATQIQQVVMNLCTNAWHAMPEGRGRIEVGLEVIAAGAARPHRLEGAPAGALAHLWVRDNGSGMDEATQRRIFEPFFTTKPVGKGTGLGLAVVHGIVIAHAGAIEVESAPGQGSTFHLAFPLEAAPADDAAGTLHGPAVEGVASAAPGRHVMCVDDDPAMLLLMQSLLERAGYRVTGFEHPRAALAAAQAEGAAFDLVVTDFNMPELSGLDLAQALAPLAHRPPVVITSGYITDEMRAGAAQAGVAALLQKEFTMERLVGVVGSVLEPTRT